jgi:AraC family transcriptional regulator of adaptative response/methylated-DNA-[protein]-cysteine methyltransferase
MSRTEFNMMASSDQADSPVLRTENMASSYLDDNSRWQAVVRRDRGADGAFFYAVRTTGVYCRTGCAARLPKRQNVRFYATGEQARRAGFRPCKRCRPDEAPLVHRQQQAVTKACRLMDEAHKAPTLAQLAAAAGLSPYHFHRGFKMLTGVTPKAYAAAHRVQRFHSELAHGATVTQAVYGAGYNSAGRFYASATERLGMTPTALRGGGRGITLRFAVGECSLGSVLVAATEIGVCAILLGDDPDALARDLQDRFPQARFLEADASFDGWVARAIELVEQPALGLELPLDIRGTAFQLRVWQELRNVPAGSTASYTQIAQRLGRPQAARAVARACAANPLAIAIPCHRVVRTDAALSGYRWGVERKAELLRREQAANKL